MLEGATAERTLNKLNYYKVELLNEWMGNPKGSVLSLMEPWVKTLLRRGTAKLVEPVTTKQEPVTTQEEKALEGPPNDKMMKKTKLRTKAVIE